jgi:hypothetical protein
MASRALAAGLLPSRVRVQDSRAAKARRTTRIDLPVLTRHPSRSHRTAHHVLPHDVGDESCLEILRTGNSVLIVSDIRIHPGVIGALTASLMGMAATIAPSRQEQFVGQVMYLTAAIAAIGPQGQKILDLVLEGGMHFPVTFPGHAIPILQKALAELEKQTTTPAVGPARH